MGTRTHIARMRGWNTASGMICRFPMNTGNYPWTNFYTRSPETIRVKTESINTLNADILSEFRIHYTHSQTKRCDKMLYHTKYQARRGTTGRPKYEHTIVPERRTQQQPRCYSVPKTTVCDNGGNTCFLDWSSESSKIQAYTNTNGQRISGVMTLTRKKSNNKHTIGVDFCFRIDHPGITAVKAIVFHDVHR